MTTQIDWAVLKALSETATQSGEGPGAVPDAKWEQLRQALVILEEEKNWSGIIKLRELFAGLLARDSAWGIPVIQELDKAPIEGDRHVDEAAK